MSSILLKNVSKSFGTKSVVKRISFEVKKGEILGFLGPNGAGKTTTMRMITGYYTPDEGSVTLSGKSMATDRLAALASVGYLPEGGPLYPDMIPLDFLTFIAEVRGLEKERAQQRIQWVIEALELSSVLYQPIDTLSKGFKRRVSLAQAILHDPEILILDEPTDGLDPNQKFEVRELIRAIAKEKIIILSTHILEEVEALCSRVIVIANGTLVAEGTPTEIAALDAKEKNLERAFRILTQAKEVTLRKGKSKPKSEEKESPQLKLL